MKSLYFRITSLALLAMLLLAACAGPTTPTTAPATQAPAPTVATAPTQAPKPTQPPKATSEPSLEDMAKAEGGQLMIYTSMSTEDLDIVLAKFKERYPFVTTEYFRDSGEEVIEQALAEAQAGQHLVDVLEIDAIELYRPLQAGLLASYLSPESAAYPDSAKDPDGYWTLDRVNTVVIAYNTELVDPADVPTNFEELLDTKWKGKLAVEISDIELLADMAGAWGKEKAYTFWQGLAALAPAMVDGHTELAEAVAAGEYAISPTIYAHRIEKLRGKGQPVEWVKTDPVFAFTQSVSLAAKAPHPNTGKLFVNWLLSEEGQVTIRDLGRIPARPGVSSDPPNLTEGLNLYYSSPSLAENYTEYADKWNTLFALK